MPIQNIICSICTEVFKNGDEVHTTSCGHLFHFSCLNNWKRRDFSCPQCRLNNPVSFKLCLTFDESDENCENPREMQLKLEKSNEKITKLRIDLSHEEESFLKLQNQVTNIEKLKKGLEGRMRQKNESKTNLAHLQRQYKDCLTHKEQLERRVAQLFIENERISKEIQFTKIKSNLDEQQQSNLSDSDLCKKIEALEQRYKQLSDNWTNEVHKSTQLCLDIMKLKVCANHLNSLQQIDASIPKKNDENLNSIQKADKENVTGNRIFKENTNPKEVVTPNSLFIKDLPLDLLTTPVENVIVNLAAKMQLKISVDDLIKVDILDNNTQTFFTAHLFVQFKTSNLACKFLSKTNVLKSDPKTKSIFIATKFIKDHSLFIYAKEMLLDHGFDHVYYKDGNIFAKKHKHHRASLYIRNKSHVDELRAKHKLSAKSEESAKLSAE